MVEFGCLSLSMFVALSYTARIVAVIGWNTFLYISFKEFSYLSLHYVPVIEIKSP